MLSIAELIAKLQTADPKTKDQIPAVLITHFNASDKTLL